MGSFFPSSLTRITVPSDFVGVETVWLDTIDGIEIEADVIRTDAPEVRATVVIAHPHPLYGGDRHNHVVRSLQNAAAGLGCHSVAVDFRGVGNSGGTHDGGDSERLDLLAACELADMMNPDGPIVMAGYSFGSVVGLNVTHPLVAGWVCMAPPVGLMTNEPIASRYDRPKILFAPEHDQFTTPDELRSKTEGWQNCTVIELAQVDHMIAVGAELSAGQGISRVLGIAP